MPSGGGSSNKRGTDSRSLLTIVVDASPVVWGERDFRRSASDKKRLAAGKRSVGPGTLEDLVRAVQAFSTSFGSLERGSGLLIVGVAHNEVAVVFPRKDHLARYFSNPETNPCYDLRQIQTDLMEGISQLITRASAKLNAAAAKMAKAAAAAKTEQQQQQQQEAGESTKSPNNPPPPSSAAMASAFSLALCCINRFLVATQTGVGVSAVRSEHFLAGSNDGGVLAVIGGEGNNNNKKKNKKAAAWSPRILLIQASEDRSRDYNAFMNCAFSAVKHNVVVDACYLASGLSKDTNSSSAFLEQACDLTGGIFLAPSGAAQVGGALTEVLMSVFLAPRSCRPSMNLPGLNKVDFRARCFETGEPVDQAFVCSQCLSIFKKKPKEICPTCQADIKTKTANKKRKVET